MSAIGGPVENSSIRGRLFASAADDDVKLDTGGVENQIEMNGNGTGRVVQSRAPWKVDGLNIEIDHARADMEFLDEVIESGEQVDMTVTFADRTTFEGRGTIVGRPEYGAKNATAKIMLAGPGKAAQQ